MADAREIVARAIGEAASYPHADAWYAVADAAIAAYHPIAMEMAAGVADREAGRTYDKWAKVASENIAAAIRAITPPLGAAMEEGK